MVVGLGLEGLGAVSDYSATIASAANTYGIDPNLLTQVIKAESNGDPNAVSPVGAMGLVQLMPGTANYLGVTNPFDPTQSINAGAKYLSQLLKQFGGDTSLALAAYNWGPGNVETYTVDSWPTETQNYVTKILNSLSGGQSSTNLSTSSADSSVSPDSSFDANSIVLNSSGGIDLTGILLIGAVGLLVWKIL